MTLTVYLQQYTCQVYLLGHDFNVCTNATYIGHCRRHEPHMFETDSHSLNGTYLHRQVPKLTHYVNCLYEGVLLMDNLYLVSLVCYQEDTFSEYS